MVRAATPVQKVDAPESERIPDTPLGPVGKAHGGFTLALFLAAPGAMLASFGFVGALMGAAQGADAALFIGVPTALVLGGGTWLGAVLLSELEG